MLIMVLNIAHIHALISFLMSYPLLSFFDFRVISCPQLGHFFTGREAITFRTKNKTTEYLFGINITTCKWGIQGHSLPYQRINTLYDNNFLSWYMLMRKLNNLLKWGNPRHANYEGKWGKAQTWELHEKH